MGLSIDGPGSRSEYILKADRESSAPTRFSLRPLTWEEKAEVGEMAIMTLEQAMQVHAITGAAEAEGRELTEEELARIAEIAPLDNSSSRRITKQHATAVRYGVVEIAGLIDRDGKPLKMTSAEFARFAPAPVLVELGTEILKRSQWSGDEIKK